MDERDPLTEAVIGAAIEAHRQIGPGLLESVYQRCLEIELKLRGIDCVAQARLPLVSKGVPLDGDDLKIDLFFSGALVVELKAVEKILPVHEAQLITYLKMSATRIGLLINFNVPLLKEGLKRVAC